MTEKSDYIENCETALKDSGARITKPRRAVIRCLSSADGALTPREILEVILKDKESEDIDQVSVYRILETLSSLGLVHQVFPSGGYIACFHIRCDKKHHVLIRCSSCETTSELDVPEETLSPMFWFLEKEVGFSPTGHVFQVNGYCKDCAGNKKVG